MHGTKVPQYKRDERAKRLRDLSRVQYRRYINDQEGSSVEVLVEKEDQGKLSGITGNYLKVTIADSPDILSPGALIEAVLTVDEGTVTARYRKLLHA